MSDAVRRWVDWTRKYDVYGHDNDRVSDLVEAAASIVDELEGSELTRPRYIRLREALAALVGENKGGEK